MNKKSYQQYSEDTYPAMGVLLGSLLPEIQPSFMKGCESLSGHSRVRNLGEVPIYN